MVATQQFRDSDRQDDGWTEIILIRTAPNRFKLQRQISYEHETYKGQPFVFPGDAETFTTDLASVPRLLAWFVPLIGTHLPATLLHDALVVDRDEDGALTQPTYLGPAVTRIEADRLFRDAMYYTGTPVIRRNLIWAGVVWATLFDAANPRLLRGKPVLLVRCLRMLVGLPRVVPLLARPVHRSDRDSTRGLERWRLLCFTVLGLVLILPTVALVPFALAGVLLDFVATKLVDRGGRGVDIDTNLQKVKDEVAAEQGAGSEAP